jgi:hypothetical protein
MRIKGSGTDSTLRLLTPLFDSALRLLTPLFAWSLGPWRSRPIKATLVREVAHRGWWFGLRQELSPVVISG